MSKTLALRWVKFNGVGAIGIVAQMAALALYKGVLGLGYLVATGLAVETAVLHNFLWHERFTWKDRPPAGARDRLLRLLKFHLGNGLISILGNLLLMRLLVGSLHWNLYLANAAAIGACALGNFAASEWFVFRGGKPGRLR
jgi:putative flippase GtrA